MDQSQETGKNFNFIKLLSNFGRSLVNFNAYFSLDLVKRIFTFYLTFSGAVPGAGAKTNAKGLDLVRGTESTDATKTGSEVVAGTGKDGAEVGTVIDVVAVGTGIVEAEVETDTADLVRDPVTDMKGDRLVGLLPDLVQGQLVDSVETPLQRS